LVVRDDACKGKNTSADDDQHHPEKWSNTHKSV
jgi:hypothetical protein